MHKIEEWFHHLTGTQKTIFIVSAIGLPVVLIFWYVKSHGSSSSAPSGIQSYGLPDLTQAGTSGGLGATGTGGTPNATVATTPPALPPAPAPVQSFPVGVSFQPIPVMQSPDLSGISGGSLISLPSQQTPVTASPLPGTSATLSVPASPVVTPLSSFPVTTAFQPIRALPSLNLKRTIQAQVTHRTGTRPHKAAARHESLSTLSLLRVERGDVRIPIHQRRMSLPVAPERPSPHRVYVQRGDVRVPHYATTVSRTRAVNNVKHVSAMQRSVAARPQVEDVTRRIPRYQTPSYHPAYRPPQPRRYSTNPIHTTEGVGARRVPQHQNAPQPQPQVRHGSSSRWMRVE